MNISEIIKAKAYREISCVTIVPQPFSFFVVFADGAKTCQKDEVGLRQFCAIVQNLEYEPIIGETDHCTVVPLGYFALLGFRLNDCILFKRNDARFPTLFS